MIEVVGVSVVIEIGIFRMKIEIVVIIGKSILRMKIMLVRIIRGITMTVLVATAIRMPFEGKAEI
jgi:hypothetical protein